MPVSDEDKRRMRRLAQDLKEFETDELVEGEKRLALILDANKRRAAEGRPLLEVPDPDAIPEQGLYDRAKRLGMVRRRR